MKILHIGATGLVGRHVLARLLADPRVDCVTAPTRRALPLPHSKLSNPVVDFDALPVDAGWWSCDAMLCTLGTTMRQAGSREAFRMVDFAYPLAAAQIAHRHGARIFVLNSAMGANPRSRIFYSRVKGELEAALAGVGFASLCLVRPGLIGGERDARRPGEHLAGIALQSMAPVLPRRWRINPASRIADAMVDAALQPMPGLHVVDAARLA